MLSFLICAVVVIGLLVFFGSRLEPTCPECGGTKDKSNYISIAEPWDGPVCTGQFHQVSGS
jgi:hypothetical protein